MGREHPNRALGFQLAREGLSAQEIANRCGVSRVSATKWRQEALEEAADKLLAAPEPEPVVEEAPPPPEAPVLPTIPVVDVGAERFGDLKGRDLGPMFTAINERFAEQARAITALGSIVTQLSARVKKLMGEDDGEARRRALQQNGGTGPNTSPLRRRRRRNRRGQGAVPPDGGSGEGEPTEDLD